MSKWKKENPPNFPFCIMIMRYFFPRRLALATTGWSPLVQASWQTTSHMAEANGGKWENPESSLQTELIRYFLG